MTDLDKIQEQLKRLNLNYYTKVNSVSQELRVYSFDGTEWLGSLYFDLDGMWWQNYQADGRKN